jgi:predicted nucleic acid-binding protein
MAPPFFDTNILLRHFLQDHPDHSPRATAFIQQIGQGERQVVLSDIVVFETVFVLERRYR